MAYPYAPAFYAVPCEGCNSNSEGCGQVARTLGSACGLFDDGAADPADGTVWEARAPSRRSWHDRICVGRHAHRALRRTATAGGRTTRPGDAADRRADLSEARADKAELRADDSEARADASHARADAADARSDAHEALSQGDRRRLEAVEGRLDVHDELITELQAEGLISTQHAANLEGALDTARVIGAAIGIVMARYVVSEVAAFELLRKASMDRNRKLREVAREVVDTGDAPGLPPLHP